MSTKESGPPAAPSPHHTVFLSSPHCPPKLGSAHTDAAFACSSPELHSSRPFLAAASYVSPHQGTYFGLPRHPLPSCLLLCLSIFHQIHDRDGRAGRKRAEPLAAVGSVAAPPFCPLPTFDALLSWAFLSASGSCRFPPKRSVVCTKQLVPGHQQPVFLSSAPT